MEYKEVNPALKYAIITYELDEENGTAIETVGHIFYGDDMEEIQDLIAAHRKTDTFFNGSFEGKWNGIKLKNEVLGLI